ncbi:hypothetical protein TBLA_0A01530 [Henningerozyma blattae CBS 6284]|uniref:CBS domain-containing protein n=1 Tax=Henningerozyma blattae (strain ATCC 34711 / CBS 6284 / DSM 70876 / NBRC 10599 / NRRL Y-10934 / UCD 77-7) TaxID=1071380 RepID=I2GV00_HENB6|nr:hypothetical protein TBLA_0A01530 [Tetrapisispora blattae CBS 6284]CCH57952.1 hypothetical protein TBLA_0A01530 [Tetrapisispora blattae CBS 6284]
MNYQNEEEIKALIENQNVGLAAIRRMLGSKTSYDMLPVSFKLVVFDTTLSVKRALNLLLQHNIVSAPLWDAKTSKFAGLLTTGDFINIIKYYFSNPDRLEIVDTMTLGGLEELERTIGAPSMDTISIHPSKPLFDACLKMLESRSGRIPLIDQDEGTNREIVVSVLTQYRILKFIALNCRETHLLQIPISELGIISTDNIHSCQMTTPVIDVIDCLTQEKLSSIPIVDENGVLINVYEAVDVLGLIKGGIYNDLSLSVGETLLRRSENFEGVCTCTPNDKLSNIMNTVRRASVHRFFVVDDNYKLLGVLSLSDILKYLLLGGSTNSPL